MSIDLTDLNNWPDGAEACIGGLFTRWERSQEFRLVDSVWFKVDNSYSIDQYRSTQVYTITMHPQEPKKYQPEIDEICLGNIRNDSGNYLYIEVRPLYDLGSEWVVQCVATSKLSYCDEFRPLKTAEEKKREVFIELALVATNSDKEDWNAIGIFKDMFNAGFTAPKEEKK